MKWYTRSCERPRKRPASDAAPSPVSNRYSLSIRTHGSSCRRRASSSPRRVSSFSDLSSSSRAAIHSLRVPVMCVVIALVSFLQVSFIGRVGWFPLTNPLKSPVVQGGTTPSSNLAPQRVFILGGTAPACAAPPKIEEVKQAPVSCSVVLRRSMYNFQAIIGVQSEQRRATELPVDHVSIRSPLIGI